jgi:DNA polymerase III subunit epsilon
VAKKIVRVPELLVGFDTETTGLDVSTERAISYGFCAYRFGHLQRTEHFFVIPDRPIADAARRVHGMSVEDLEARRGSDLVLGVEGGLARAAKLIREFHQQGAFFVGANLVRFDLEMLRRSYQSVIGRDLADDGVDLSALRIIDVTEHDLVIEPSRDRRPRRGLSYLCRHYGVQPGGHDALDDARATVEVFLEQVVHNNAGQSSLDLGVAASEASRPDPQPNRLAAHPVQRS